MVANRIIQLDSPDARARDVRLRPRLACVRRRAARHRSEQQRDRVAEALDVILRLLDGQTVTEKTEWYNLVNARVHLMPYTQPRPRNRGGECRDLFGGRMAGKYD